jgi:NAD(P)-dependent dehydrogenase (short-subunit alcohol dehydrogenase family)
MIAQARGLLDQQVAVVTGASSGIGQALAWALARQGATLCVVGRNEHALRRTVEGVGPSMQRAVFLEADLAQDEGIERVRHFVDSEFGALDILVHSAGVMYLSRLEDASLQHFDLQYTINLRTPYQLTQKVLALLKASRGQVVFVNSSVGLLANRAEVGQYAASKHGLKAVADALRDEVNADGVRVLSVYPGRTATPLQFAVHEMEGRPYHPERLLQAEDVAAIVLSALVLPRTAEVTDITIRPMMKC